MEHRQTQEEWEEEMSLKILDFVRNEVYMDLRFLGVALSALVPRANGQIHALATDGKLLYFSTEQLLRVFQNNARYLDRAYLHTVLHCIFEHLWIGGGREPECWNIACDIAVEYTIDCMDKPCTKRLLSWSRQCIYEKIRENRQGASAAVIYRMLTGMEPEERRKLAREFFTDDHCFWPKQNDSRASLKSAEENQKNWNKIARQTKIEQQRGKNGGEAGEILSAMISAQKSRRSYREFLQKFSVLREELHCDPDEFDLGYYTYGLNLYGNLPLMEPLESRERKKIREFVIVIDTSYSTGGELVSGFLRETADILRQSDSFFSDSRIRVLQCDNKVQKDTLIEGTQELERFLEQFELLGGGGTDFRPAFSYVNELLQKGACKNLGGLLYFTDGKGIYPRERPAYQTAFLFLEEYDTDAVPPWAMRLKLEPEEFKTPDNAI
ncbi:MAG: metallopeptidase [Roseburia sp.]|nr:metallopeptidase [Roseburia sp.]